MPTPGYLVTLKESGAYLGGVMITNDHGFPIDFKYTDPVTPTKVQHIIYGPVLEQYIRNHVIIGALSSEISNPADFYVVSQHQLHDIAEASELPLLSLQRTQLAPLAEKGAVNRAKENECLLQGFGDQHPTRIIFGSMTVEQQEQAIKDLTYLSKHMDLVEPLDRLEKAVVYLCGEQQD